MKNLFQGKTLHVIEGVSFISQNYLELLDLLKNTYGNQQYVAAHMNELLKMKKKLTDKDPTGLRKFFGNVKICFKNQLTFSN